MRSFFRAKYCFLLYSLFFFSSLAWAANSEFQGFFFNVCSGAPTGNLATRCAETPGSTGNLSGDSESSLNPNQSLSSNESALGRVKTRMQKIAEHTEQLRGGKESVAAKPDTSYHIDQGPFSLLINGQRSSFSRDAIAGDTERAYEGDSAGLDIGLDYRLSDRLVIGSFLSFSQENIDISADLPGVNFLPLSHAGSRDVDIYSVSFFGAYSLPENAYIEANAGYGWESYTINRNVVFQESGRVLPQTNVLTRGTPDGREYWLGLGVGVDYNRAALSFGPYFRASYLRSEIDAYSEQDLSSSGLQMQVNAKNRSSKTMDVGIRASYASSQSWGVLLPQVSLEYEHEFGQDALTAVSRFILDSGAQRYILSGDEPDRDYANLGIGIVAVLSGGTMFFMEYRGLFANSDLDRDTVSTGLRLEFI